MEEIEGMGISIVVAGIIAGIGFGADKLLLPKQRSGVSEVLTVWWCNIDDTRVPDALPRMATIYLNSVTWLFGTQVRRILISGAILSIVATTLSLIIGDYIWFKSLALTLENWWQHRPAKLYPVNLLLDGGTLVVTSLIMRQIRTVRAVFQLLLLTFDIVFAFFLAFFGFYVGNAFEFPETAYWTQDDIRKMFGAYLTYFNGLGWFDAWFAGGGWLADAYRPTGGEWPGFLYASTVVIPTVFYLSVMLLVGMSHLTIHIGRSILMHLFRLDVETEKSIFYYSAVLIGLLLVLGRGVAAFV